MTFDEFKNNIIEHISALVGDEINVYSDTVIKNNGTQLEGLVISNPKINIAPTIYLNQYYGRYLDGCTISDIVTDIYNTYVMHLPDKDFDLDKLENFNSCKDSIIMKLVNYQENLSFLANVPYDRYLDFAIIFQYVVEIERNHTGTITINNSIFKDWNITLDELSRHARLNTPKLLPHTLDDILEYLPEYVSNEEYIQEGQFFKMYVLTNKKKMYGATTLLYDGLLEQIANSLESNLLLIPSSIHEVILIPVSEDESIDIDYFNELIEEVNTCELSDEEVLSSHAYFFNRKQAYLV